MCPKKKYNSIEQDKYTHELYISLDIPTAKTVLAGLLTTCRGTMGTKNKMHFFFGFCTIAWRSSQNWPNYTKKNNFPSDELDGK
jgi:hypothetical protein